MKTVLPIKDKQLIKDILDFLVSEDNIRDYMLFYLGINLGLRISDLLKLKVYQIKNKDRIYIVETKTKKESFIPIFPHVRKEISKYLEIIPNNLYVFQASYSINPICRIRAYQILKKVQRKFQLDDIGTHTLRKTFGYHYYQDTKDIGALTAIFNHASPKTTMRYIDITQEMIRDSLIKWGGLKK